MLVSVAIPAYNQADYLREAISSVLAQTYTEVEIIVVDDGSTDHTRDVCGEFNGRLRYIYQENDGTCGGTSRTRAIRECRGEFVALLDHDDRWLPEKLSQQVRMFSQAPSLAVVFTGWRGIDAAGKSSSQDYLEAPSGNVFHALLQRDWYVVSSALIRREVVLDHLSALQMGPGDYSLWLSISRRHEVGFVKECLTEYRSYDGNYSSDYVRGAREIEALLTYVKEHRLLHPDCEHCLEASASGLKEARETRAQVYFQQYCRLAKRGQLPLALTHFRQMLALAPGFIFNTRRILATAKSGLYGIGRLRSS